MQDRRSETHELRTCCAIAGGGPAGMVLGFLLARAGVGVVVLEKHSDFLRDFRGDTIHPSTLEVMHELGLLDQFLELPHQKIERVSAQIGDTTTTIADFTHLPTRCKYVALMPQWDFLNFLAVQGKRYAGFDLRMQAQVTGLIEENGRVVGLTADTPDRTLAIRADLVVGADGRHSTVREKAGLKSDDYGAPMDVLWFRVPRRTADRTETLGHVETGMMLVMFDRGDYWQCAYVIAKGAFEAVKAAGLEAFRRQVVLLSPFLADGIDELKSWDNVKLLSVAVDRLRQWWRPGLICIGDAAHAMSPIGGVGVNLAVQDAVAAANRLAGPLKTGTATSEDLRAIELRRAWPVRFTQRLQLTAQNRVIGPVLRGEHRIKSPSQLKLLDIFPVLRRIPAYLLGIGIRPEHVAVGEATAPALSTNPSAGNHAR